jgi:hypothetical protein
MCLLSTTTPCARISDLMKPQAVPSDRKSL